MRSVKTGKGHHMSTLTPSVERWVRRFHPSSERAVQLACFPYAGGSASYYFPLSDSLKTEVESLSLQYPGRQDRIAEACIEKVPELADRAYEALRESVDGRPLVFFGHSMGSILAFEVARRFQDSGRTPSWLFASGYPAPSRLRGGSVHLRDDAGIVEELRTVGGTDPAWLEDQSLLSSILPPVRSDYKAIETHIRTLDAKLNCPITMLVGDSDPHTTAAESEAWQDHTSGDFELRVFSGGHFFLDQYGAEIADAISATVKKILR
ncbi:thioesterase II family protein [Streptomyces sp. NPDC048516]|uniref:thioesterase II family protein n=1 Tax=Streptomyces sp. NPDC048516 TaxID=3365565 RepID=UPI003712EEA3